MLLLIVGGLGAAAGANLWTQPWIIASAIVFVVIIAVMYMRRDAVLRPDPRGGRGARPGQAGDDADGDTRGAGAAARHRAVPSSSSSSVAADCSSSCG